MPTLTPRAVFVVRPTEYELLVERHGTRGQAAFFLGARGQAIGPVEEADRRFRETLHAARAAAPGDWRQALVRRADLDRFLFGPEDVVVAVGPDGLVANVAKYLDGQPVLGVDPAADGRGVLMRVGLARLPGLLRAAAAGAAPVERRTMAQAVVDGGERLLALNELFVGHRSHQSARYLIEHGSAREDQSSSGLIVATGTGATGWARSIAQGTGGVAGPAPSERALAFHVREPWPSATTGTAIRHGALAGEPLAVTSRMNEGGVVFADGMEGDFLPLDWGRRVLIGVAERRLHLVTP